MDSDLPVTVHGFGAVCGVVVVFTKTRLSNDAKSYQNKGKSTEISRFQCFFGGDKRDRTADLLNAIQALSQLSYTPMYPETLEITGFPGY